MVNIGRLIVKLFLIFITLCLTLVSIISGVSIGLLFSSPDNIYLDMNNMAISMNNTKMEIGIPYAINNLGFYDINNMRIYYNISAFNSTDRFHLTEGESLVGSFPARIIINSSINITANMSREVNHTLWSTWKIDLDVEMQVRGLYALDLMNFVIGFIVNYTLWGS
ncbi:MAG: hypothetical protein ACTSPY_01600 [Candidatus Helarchaeota archaeon]